MSHHYHGIHLDCSPSDAWALQEAIHARRPERIIEIGKGFGGLSAWLHDCMAAELIHPFVLLVTDSKPHNMANYPDITCLLGEPDSAMAERAKPYLRAPTMIIVNRFLTQKDFDMWCGLATPGQSVFAVDGSFETPTGFNKMALSESMAAFERLD